MAEPSPVSDEVLAQIALSRDEYEQARERLGREPSHVELGMIGALWSEHCGYKHSKPLFRYFPTEGPQILTELGTENAGAVDIGDGWVVVMKVESHNHPSAIEPYEGAATGVGGIVRDIFAMGARPIALLDSLRFGPLDDAHNRHLFSGVVSGIGGYGNCLGIPNVGGEVVFGEGYSGNPLVNAMCVGIAPVGSLVGGDDGRTGRGVHGGGRRHGQGRPTWSDVCIRGAGRGKRRASTGGAGRKPVPRKALDGGLCPVGAGA